LGSSPAEAGGCVGVVDGERSSRRHWIAQAAAKKDPRDDFGCGDSGGDPTGDHNITSFKITLIEEYCRVLPKNSKKVQVCVRGDEDLLLQQLLGI
jgi:hypothetical protein